MLLWRPLIAAGAGALLAAAWPASAVHTYTIVIDKLKFGPPPASLHKGDTIVWVNHDFVRHSATASNHSFDIDLQPGARASMVVKSVGAIPFVCRYHPGMHGMLEVE
jgi:plastocyanin